MKHRAQHSAGQAPVSPVYDKMCSPLAGRDQRPSSPALTALVFTVLVLTAAIPLYAQDDLGAFGGLFGGDVGLSAPPAARGAAPPPANRGNAPAPDRLVRLKDALAKAGVPLGKDQEAALNALLDGEVPIMRKSLQAKVVDLGLRPTSGPVQPAQRGAAAQLPALDAKTEVTLRRLIYRLNDQLFEKLIASPTLQLEQHAILTTLYKDQIRGRGGLDSIQLALNEAGTPFTAEQLGQIQPIFDEQDQTRLEMQRAGSAADAAKTAQLEQTTLLRVLRLMTAEQRAALQKASSRPQP